MFKSMFKARPTSKFDVLFAFTAAIGAVWKAHDTYKDYKAEHEAAENEETK